MTRQLKENIHVISYELLKVNIVSVTRSYLQNQLYFHLDYPSLVSVRDVLKEYKVGNHSSFERTG
jgi:uncharacterized membrane protein